MYENLLHRDLMTLVLEDDTQLQLQPIVKITIDETSYVALTTQSATDESVYFYTFTQQENGEIQLNQIKEKQELEKVLDAFEAWLELLDQEEQEES